MEEKHDEVEDVESVSSDSFLEEPDNNAATNTEDDGFRLEEPLTEEEIEDLIAELVETESKAAEAQESLEDESLAKVEIEVREELKQSLHGEELEKAVADEMATLREEWETLLDELETESAHLLEQLDGAGIELPSLYKWIESQAPNGCSTEAWKKRTHWVGAPVSNDVAESVAHAEKYLRTQRPVRRRHGKVLEEGASGYLEKKLSVDDSKEASMKNSDVDWSSFNRIASGHKLEDSMSFGSKHWASVYLASTPQQAAEMGLNFPGADQVEEIDDVDGNSSDPLIADAIANEEESILSETHKGKLRKVKEEEDMITDKKLQLHLKRRRQRNRCKQDATLRADSLVHNENDVTSTDVDLHEAMEISEGIDNTKSASNGTSESSDFALPGLTEARGSKRLHDDTELSQSNKAHIVTIDTDDESHATGTEPRLLGHDESTIPVSTLNLKEEFHCTACHKVATDIVQHPILKVIVCRDCKILIESKMSIQDPDCSECYCGWCGRNKDLVSCKLCKVLFCNTCIRKNLGEECSLNVKVSGWQCCCCSPSMLQRLTAELEKAIGSTGAIASSSDSESDNSGGNISFTISTKRRRKKKIRRILDDAELGEETKKKIAIEKERQERLKSLEAQFSGKSVLTRSVSFSREVFEGGSAEVLGDALTGYIVNVVREKGEEVVRIPPSISGKLKTHQIAGVRFMWENIVQSITKVKSGDKGLGCILAHTMGLGKTFQVIAFLYTAMRSADLGLRTALIVTPVSVLHNWRHEFNMWKPSELKPLRVYMLEDVPRERRVDLLAKWRKKGGVFLIGYSAFRNLSLGKHTKDRNLAKELCNSLQDGPDILVCDEAHMIKNTRADTTQALKLVKCQRRIALTGSPLQNNLMEYYCMVDFVREGFLGSSHEFRNRFQNPIENGQHTNSTSDDVKIMNQRSHILYEQLKGFVQRMDMSVVQKDLPTKTVYVIAVKLSPLQRKLYKKFLDVHGFAGDKITGEKFQKRNFFAGYQALAQIWNHPGNLQLMKEDKDYRKGEDIIENFAEYSSSDENIDCNMMSGEKPRNKNEIPQKKDRNSFFQEDWWKDLLQRDNYKEIGNSGKMVLLIDILTMSSDVGDKALVFSQSLSTLDLIELYLSKLPRRGRTGKSWKQGKDWYRLDGRTAASERQKLVEKFNDPSNKRVKCTLISTRAGSLGINLHSANRVIIVDGSWNPTHDLQAIYRAWRYGQKKPVFAYRLMAHGTMEEKIYKRQVNKEGLAARVVDRQQVHRTLSKEELLHLFEFGDDELPDPLTEHGQDDGHPFKQTGGDQGLPKQKLTREGNLPSDKFMERLLAKHHPSWIANYHEHETLLQENEDEKLSKEEQDMAWEVYQKTLEWEEVQRIPVDESATLTQKPSVPKPPPSTAQVMSRPKPRLRNHWTKRHCTSMSHMLTLRSQGTKAGCTTICGECAREISWGDKGMK